jgi:hypothetical protein
MSDAGQVRIPEGVDPSVPMEFDAATGEPLVEDALADRLEPQPDEFVNLDDLFGSDPEVAFVDERGADE